MYAMYFIFLFCFNWPNIYVGSLIEKKKQNTRFSCIYYDKLCC